MQLVLATNNKDKIREIKQLLEDLPVTIMTRDDFLDFPDPEETGTTLEENAILKAREISAFPTHLAVDLNEAGASMPGNVAWASCTCEAARAR